MGFLIRFISVFASKILPFLFYFYESEFVTVLVG
jgi:hypothetical protein